ncbi:MAG TPA: HD domain-containing phosphohydrolase [Steroidobacteraceae bacterium]|nr:HD domain-containing phosphohydrolase [Steroidobacteraceae bacterium]
MKTVLLAYERDQDLAAVESVLQSRGHRVLKARSGVEALEAIRGETTPDAVVSDVLLPRLDGFALCRRLREDPAFLHLPFVLHSFRVEGPKYEAFAAEVGAQRFLPRGSTLDDLAAAIDEQSPGSGTMRMPALVPELLDRREQDRRRLTDLERQVRELGAQNQQLAAAERVARERAEHESRARAEFAASESVRIRDLQGRIRDLEASQRQAREAAESGRKQVEAAQQQTREAAESAQKQIEAAQQQARAAAENAARGVAEEARAEISRLAALETRLAELNTARARAQSAANDAERAFATQPTPTFIVDVESRLVHAANDAAAALTGLESAALRGKPLAEVLPGAADADDTAREALIDWRRQDGSPARLQLVRLPTSYAGRACWIVSVRDVTEELALRARERVLAVEAAALAVAPEACGIVDADGRFQYANAALLELLAVDKAGVAALSLQSLAAEDAVDSTVRTAALADAGIQREHVRWRRADAVTLDVELAVATCAGDDGLRVITARDVTATRRTTERNERDQLRVARLLELAQRAHALTEGEIQERALELAQELTASPLAYLFLAGADMPNVELAARRGGEAGTVPFARWRGAPPQDTALYECLGSQRPIAREASEATGTLRQAGLPDELARQAVTPLLDGGRLVGALLVADAPRPYDDDDRRHLAQVADATWKLLRRRRSDAEVVSAMDHMERVMFGAIESLALLAEAQDACKIGRSKRVADYASAIGVSLGLPGHTIRGLRVMGQLVDVGMLQIPRELLWRPGTLAPSEFELIKTHAERGYEVLRAIEFPWPVAEVVRQHHERLDGSGYPRGLRGEEILLEARIVAVADAVEAMLAQRPHRPALTLAACIEELQSQAGRRYDARVVKACVRVLRETQSPGTLLEDATAPAGQRIA